MVSNPKIFSFDSTQVDPSVEWATPITDFLGKWVKVIFGVSEDRFIQFHTVVYGLGIAVFLVLFVIERVTGLLSRLISAMVNYCSRKSSLIIIEEFSTNLLKELSFDDLQTEYTQTMHQLSKAISDSQNNSLEQSKALYQYYLAQLQFKVRKIKI